LLGLALFTLAPTAAFTQPAAETAQADQKAPPAAKHPTGGYYVEFRVASIGAYGHSYAMYGVTGGRPNFTDLHPMGNYAIMAVGHLLPVPANTQWDPDVAKLPVSSRYRKSLDAAQYKKLLAAIAVEKANKSPVWNALANNCNHYIGRLAEAVGMRVPNGTVRSSYFYVPALRDMNEGGGDRTPAAHASATAAHKKRAGTM
jgi:hypothetical protein